MCLGKTTDCKKKYDWLNQAYSSMTTREISSTEWRTDIALKFKEIRR